MIKRKKICKNCVWSSEYYAFDTLECRRHAPIYKKILEDYEGYVGSNHQFALVEENCWCGDYEAKAEENPDG